MSKIVVLDSFSWEGVSLGAVHWYGNLHEVLLTGSGVRVSMNGTQLLQPRTKKIATDLNKYSRGAYSEDLFEVGEPCERFESLEHLTEYAIEHYKEYFPDAVMLLHNTGSLAACECFDVLDAHLTLQRYSTNLGLLYRVQRSAYNEISELGDDAYSDLTYQLYKQMNFLLAKVIRGK